MSLSVCFVHPVMEPVDLVEMQPDKQEAVDVTSWVCVCPGGLWRVQRNETHEWTQQISSNTADDTCRAFLLVAVSLIRILWPMLNF